MIKNRIEKMKCKVLFVAIALAFGLFNFIKVQAQNGERVYLFGYACSIKWDSNLQGSHKLLYISNINDFDKKTSIAWQSVNANPLWRNHFRNISKPYPNNEFMEYVETKYDYQSIINRRSEIINSYQQRGFEIHQVNDFVIPPKDIIFSSSGQVVKWVDANYKERTKDQSEAQAGQQNNQQQQSNMSPSNASTSSLVALQAQQERERQALAARQAENERQRTQQAERQRNLDQHRREHQEQVRQQQEAQNKANHDAAVTAYYAQKRAENLQKGAQDLANVIAEGVSFFAAQQQASRENAERYRLEALAEEKAEKERLAAEEEEKERIREEQAMARAEAERLENERIAAERDFRMNSRSNVFTAFKEADIPLSNSKVEFNKLYYFIYAYDNNNLAEENFVVFLSAPFEIDRFSDGTWPYKKNVMGEIAQLTPFQEILHGYYTSAEEAYQMYKSFSELLANTNTVIKPVSYKGKISASATNAGSNANFWGETAPKAATGEVKKAESGTPVKKSQEYDFWGNPVNK